MVIPIPRIRFVIGVKSSIPNNPANAFTATQPAQTPENKTAWPTGRVVEIYGPESSGKTTLTLHAIAECQRKGGIAAFIDAEHAFDRFYAEKLGVNTDELIVSQPDNGEQALEIADNLVRSGRYF